MVATPLETRENQAANVVTGQTEVEGGNGVVLKPKSCELKQYQDFLPSSPSPVLTVVMELAGRSVNLLLESCFASVVGIRRRLWSYICIMPKIKKKGAF